MNLKIIVSLYIYIYIFNLNEPSPSTWTRPPSPGRIPAAIGQGERREGEEVRKLSPRSEACNAGSQRLVPEAGSWLLVKKDLPLKQRSMHRTTIHATRGRLSREDCPSSRARGMSCGSLVHQMCLANISGRPVQRSSQLPCWGHIASDNRARPPAGFSIGAPAPVRAESTICLEEN